MQRITTKRRMYELLHTGRFGNYPRAWHSLAEVQQSGYTGHVSIRSLEVNNPVRLYHVPAKELGRLIAELPERHRAAGLTFSESPDDSLRVVQGEYNGNHLTYSFARYPMRIAFEHECLHARGFLATCILTTYLEANDFDWLRDLLADFPDSTVEFSAFRRPVGTQAGSKMIVWEVRHY